LDVLRTSSEVDEGFLICNNCKTVFPIIHKIPIIVEDFVSYIGNRSSLGGKLYDLSDTLPMKRFIKNSLSKIKKSKDDYSLVEKRWSKIYTSNRNSSFYSFIKNKLCELHTCENVLELGSSIGIITNSLRKKHQNVFGVDISFYATMIAKEKSFTNSDFFVADILNHPFGKKKFELILALNILEVVEPSKILESISKQLSNGHVLLTDPYDYDRGHNSVRLPLYEKDVRQKLQRLGFSITNKTNTPSSINWILNINPRTKLIYKVDIIIGKK
tara:strand:+ start:1112 stop:1927 length:816 start_codon:yes stop_codon:yes gene_type:complete